MKTYSDRGRSALILMTACFLFVNGDTVVGSDAQSRRVVTEGYGDGKSVREPARLIIRRIPDLGNDIVVSLYVDGMPAGSIGYGRTYKAFLRPGQHVLSVWATPAAKWLYPWHMNLNVRNGGTYAFIATGNHSGNLILRKDYDQRSIPLAEF